VRGAAIAAAGLADMSLGLFLPGLIVGSLLFLSLHFFLGIVGGSALFALSHVYPLPTFILVVLALFVLVYALWAYASRRQRAEIAHAAQENEAQEGEALEVWHEGICPVCLALYAANQLRSYTADQFTV
jgi:membrane protein implicated in regulation of membrane protease activity